MGEQEEINRLLNDAMKKKYEDGEKFGYLMGLNDFYEALKTTKMTPEEIFKKLKIQ